MGENYDIKGLENGEVIIYSIHGNEIKLKKDGSIEIKGDIKVDGKIEVTGDIEAEGDVKAMKTEATSISLKDHTHPTALGPTGMPMPM